MSLTVVLVLVVATASILALALVVLGLLKRLKTLAHTVGELQERLNPVLAELAAESEVTQRELARLADAAEGLRGSRGPRRRAGTDRLA